MATTTVAHPAPESTTEPGYVLRGHGLFELHRDELLSGYQGGGRWLVPSGTVADRLYEVRVGVRRPSTCECVGYQHHQHCSHVVAAKLASKKSALCDCCGERHWDREPVEVTEEDGLLSWYEGDRLCRECVPRFWA